MRRIQPAIALLLVMTGCSLAPEYRRPPMPVPAELMSAADSGSSAPAAGEWRQVFADPRLQAVIDRALESNRDLRVAALNVDRAEAMFRIQRADLSPGLGVQASGTRTHVGERMTGDVKATTGEYAVMVGIPAWEIDLFGRVRSLRDAALHQYFATRHARNATELSLVAAVAGSWLTLAADEELLTLARSTLESNTASLDLIERSRDLGVANDLSVHQARSLVESARADVARLEGRVVTDRNTLALLVGEVPADELLPAGLAGEFSLAEVRAGLSSEVLLQRPDILAAEEQLIAANANIGAARAAFFPRITLTAGVGTLSPELSALFGSGTGSWTFAPQLVSPIFAGGALRANLEATTAARDIAVAQYEKAIQSAFAETSDALAQRSSLSNERIAVEALVSSLENTHRLAKARYEGGIDSYLQVLDAERSLFAARQRLVGMRLAEEVNRVTLFKVLAGENAAP